MIDPLLLLHMPPGPAGSGRVRYGAAMELFRQGVLSEAQLDAYRDASPHDGLDSARLLAERRLPPVPAAPGTPEAALLALFATARDYLLALRHPGAADVRAGLAACEAKVTSCEPHGNGVVSRWLAPAVASVEKDQPQLAASVASAAPHLAWITYDGYPVGEIGKGFAEGHAYAPIAGGNAPFRAHDFELGLFLIAPNVLYRDHCHAAPELYAPLTGPHGWRFGVHRPLILKPAGEPVWNPPLQSHLTKVGKTPFLCLYVWTRDVAQVARVIPAGDWTELEARRL